MTWLRFSFSFLRLCILAFVWEIFLKMASDVVEWRHVWVEVSCSSCSKIKKKGVKMLQNLLEIRPFSCTIKLVGNTYNNIFYCMQRPLLWCASSRSNNRKRFEAFLHLSLHRRGRSSSACARREPIGLRAAHDVTPSERQRRYVRWPNNRPTMGSVSAKISK